MWTDADCLCLRSCLCLSSLAAPNFCQVALPITPVEFALNAYTARAKELALAASCSGGQPTTGALFFVDKSPVARKVSFASCGPYDLVTAVWDATDCNNPTELPDACGELLHCAFVRC